MESKYDVRSDILFVTDKVFRKFMDRIPDTKPNKHPQIIENLVKDVLRENFTDYNPIDRAEIYNYVIGLKTIFTPDRYVPKSIDCVNLVDILSHGTPITTNPDGIVIFDPDTIGSGNRGERRYDLPGGGKRMVMPSQGVLYTLVNGDVVYADGKIVGSGSGQILRS